MGELDEIGSRDTIRLVLLEDGSKDVLGDFETKICWTSDLARLQQKGAISSASSLISVPGTGVMEAKANSVAREVIASAIGIPHQGNKIVSDISPDAAGVGFTLWCVPSRRCILLGGSASGAIRRVEAAHDALVRGSTAGASCLKITNQDNRLGRRLCETLMLKSSSHD